MKYLTDIDHCYSCDVHPDFRGDRASSDNLTLLGNWLGAENGLFYRFVGAGILPSLSRCDNISPQEAVRVSESLQYLPYSSIHVGERA
jgi:hypothetical protein